MDSNSKEMRDTLRSHFLFLMKHMNYDIMLLCFLYAHEDGIIGTLFMEDYFASLPSKRNFDLLLHVSKKGKKGIKAFIEGLVYTNQKHIADMLDVEISTAFYESRKSYHPSF